MATDWTTPTSTGTARTHPPGDRWGCSRACRRRGGSGSTMQLVGHWSRLRGHGDLIVVTPTTQVDDIAVVRVLEDAHEIPLAEALAIPPQQLERLLANVARGNGSLA